jgi:hypothetical protein
LYMPDVRAVTDLHRLLTLGEVTVHPVDVAGVPYVGVQFEARWDDEHGAGVLLHGLRVVDVGLADTAYLLWIAERDARRILGSDVAIPSAAPAPDVEAERTSPKKNASISSCLAAPHTPCAASTPLAFRTSTTSRSSRSAPNHVGTA